MKLNFLRLSLNPILLNIKKGGTIIIATLTVKLKLMSAILTTNTSMPANNAAIVMSVNTKQTSTRSQVKKQAAKASQWYQQYCEKAPSFDWDVYRNELEFE